MIGLEVFARLVTSRVGLVAVAILALLIFYEGVPAGPLRLIPGIQWVIPEGRVAAAERAAREGYVRQAELAAAQARLGEVERQLAAGRKALDSYADLLAESQAREALANTLAEAEIARYEQQLASSGRSCRLDQSDIDWLRK